MDQAECAGAEDEEKAQGRGALDSLQLDHEEGECGEDGGFQDRHERSGPFDGGCGVGWKLAREGV